MSLSRIDLIADDLEAAIATLVPDLEPDRRWALHRGGGLLESATLEADADRLRVYQALPDIDGTDGDHWNGNLAHVSQSVLLELRYHVPDCGRERRGWRRVSRLAGCDVTQIAHLVCGSWSWALRSGQGLEDGVTLRVDRRLKQLNPSTYYARLRLTTQYPYPVTEEA